MKTALIFAASLMLSAIVLTAVFYLFGDLGVIPGFVIGAVSSIPGAWLLVRQSERELEQYRDWMLRP